MRSTLSDDLQGIGWWLASDGRWYPPDLNPAAPYAAAGEQARIAALFDAAIGVARVRDKVYAAPGSASSSPDERAGPHFGGRVVGAEQKSPARGNAPRRDGDPLPRFGAPDRPGWPFEPRSASEPVTSRPETRWRPETRQRADTRRPPSRSVPERPAPSAPALEPSRRSAFAPEPLPRFKPVRPHGAEEPCEQVTASPSVPPPPPDVGPEPAQMTVEAPAIAPALPTATAPAPPPAPDAAGLAGTEPASGPPPVVAETTTTTHERIGPPPRARRRPSTVRSPSDLRDAVAGAVARAAAQGPLMPRSPEDHAGLGPGEARAYEKLARDEAPYGTQAPVEPEPGVPGMRVYDPYEEFTRLAGEHALSNAGPRRRSNRLSSSPETSPVSVPVPSGEGAEPAPAETVAGAAGSDVSLVASIAPSEPEVLEPELVVTGESEPAGESEPEFLEAELVVTGEREPAGESEPEVHAPPVPGSERTSEPEPRFPGSEPEPDVWPIGERRSSARPARKPLPAALQAVVASEISNSDVGEQPSEPVASRQPPAPAPAFFGSTTGSENGRVGVTTKRPGVIRRYASAIAIVVVFAAAAGAAAGIAAFRGPTRPGLTSVAQARAAVDNVLLRAGDFPPPWHVAKAATTAASFGVASGLVTPSLVHSFVAANPGCAGDLAPVGTTLTATNGGAAAVASTEATASDPLGGSWQTTDVAAYHSDAATVTRDFAALRRLLTEPAARSCLNRFLSASLLAGLPTGSYISLSVASAPLPALPGSPPAFAMSMGGTAAVRGVTLPFRFEVTSFEVGHIQVSLTSTSKLVPLPLSLNQALLVVLATRAELQSP